MQKIIIVIILITSFLNENNAQIQKGSWMLGGDVLNRKKCKKKIVFLHFFRIFANINSQVLISSYMKKTFITIALITNVLCENTAQIHKGSWLIGGNMSLTHGRIIYGDSQDIQKSSNTFGEINAEAGYFASDRLAVGAKLGFEWFNIFYIKKNYSRLNITDWMLQEYRVSPFVRYYVTPKHKFKTFYEFNLDATWYRSNYTNYSYIQPSWSNTYQLDVNNRIGADYFLTPNIALEGSLTHHFFYNNNMMYQEDGTLIYMAGGAPNPTFVFPKWAFNPQFRVRLFLNTEKQDTKILAAQYFKKGNITMGMTSEIKFGSFNYADLKPTLGYFLTDKWMVASEFAFYYSPQWGVRMNMSPEIRYYQPVSPSMHAFLRGAMGFGVTREWQDVQKTYATGKSVDIGVGLNRFIAENIAVEGLLNFENEIWQNKLDIQPHLKLGFQYFMNRKKIY